MRISPLKREKGIIRSGIIFYFNFSFNHINPCHAVISHVCWRKKVNKAKQGMTWLNCVGRPCLLHVLVFCCRLIPVLQLCWEGMLLPSRIQLLFLPPPPLPGWQSKPAWGLLSQGLPQSLWISPLLLGGWGKDSHHHQWHPPSGSASQAVPYFGSHLLWLNDKVVLSKKEVKLVIKIRLWKLD